ncbi:MAG: sugar porter family MFS transporter [Kiritimatiellae bacterium]|nr:sugar porter family MFS transporter [Kiritimatiellia bacterium]MDD5522055.1 sugar porter family MFS transporter [Kiritimatiellia bacterium]
MITNSGSGGTTDSGVKPVYNMAYVWTISLVAAMGGLLFGYDWVVIGGAKPFFEKFFELSGGKLSGWANSCALLGCLVGSIITGTLSDRFGRKKLLVLSAVLFAVSSVFTGWASTFNTFVVWRIIGGIAIGMASNLSPIYIAEVAPAHMRGRLVAINQLTIVIGILAAQIVNWWLAVKLPHSGVDAAAIETVRQTWNNTYGWRWMFTAVTVPSLMFFVGALLVPESPRWLVKNGVAEEAGRILSRIGGQAYADAEVKEIQNTIVAEETQHVRFADLLEPKLLKIVLIGCALAVLQQWSGINSIFNYAEEIYKSAGYGISDIMFNIVITGAINLVFTLVAIGTVDRLGRRILMLIGCAGIGISHVLLGTAYAMGMKGMAVLVFTLCSLGCYGLSLAPIVWVLISELFPNRIRGAAVSVAVSALWVACFILTFVFPILKDTVGMAGTFWIYAGICFAGFVFVWMKVPETKGKSLEQIEKELVD